MPDATVTACAPAASARAPRAPAPRAFASRVRASRVRQWMALVPTALTFGAGGADLAAQARPPRDPSPHSDVALVAAQTAVTAGQRITVAVRLILDPGWHTYWTNPGDAGLPLEVTWTLPDGVTAGPLQFPTPRLTPQPPLMSYGYERELLALVELQLPPSLDGKTPLRLRGTAKWLACADVCLPGSGSLLLELPVMAGGAATPTPWAAAIERTRAQLPAALLGWTARAWTTPDGVTVALVRDASATRTTAASFTAPYVFADSAGVIDAAAPQRVAIGSDTVVIALPRAPGAADTATRVSGIIASDIAATEPRSYRLDVALHAPVPAQLRARASALLAGAHDIGGVSGVPAATSALALPDPTADMTLVAAIAFAFLGGVLLNLMPCVFPVLTVKVLALLDHGGTTDDARARWHAVAFGAGVLLSFWLLAGVLLALRAGGEQLGWGFQLQSPIVVALLALLMFGLALNLSGVFEIGLALTRLGGVGAGRGYLDSLLTGALAVVVAAPCTAPFMGAALGYALVQPAVVGLLVFTALGLGLALPFMLLASVPALLRVLPRPGPWLGTVRQLFAFPLYATVVWLLWVFGQQAGVDALAVVLLALILLALGAWTWARGVHGDRGATRGIASALMLGAVAVATISATRARPPSASTVVAGWEPWSTGRFSTLRNEGRAVFIDFTAAWCLSCQVNERIALRTDAVRRAFAEGNVALLRADWTSRDSSITEVLAGFGRSGVPLYVLYPAGRDAAAVILPAVLTPGMVVTAVSKAAPATVVLQPR